MPQVRYTKDHEYIRIEDGVGVVGITVIAQERLGDITYVETPAVGKTLKQEEAAGVVESVKAASEVYSPVGGKVIEVNEALADRPELVNEDAEGAAWFFKIQLADPSELGDLMEKDAYLDFAKEQG